jgi:chloramphenicol-sensitive protein RarD
MKEKYLTLILFSQKKFSWLNFFKDIKKTIMLILAGIAVTCSWGLFIWAVNNGYTLQTSLGYYINPLIAIVLGLCFFKEKLKPLQWIALGLAVTGVLIQTIFNNQFPWISISLAVSFGLYGLIKKTVSLSALESVGAETLLAAPIGLVLLFYPFGTSTLFPDGQDISYIMQLPLYVLILLLFAGAATSIPLYLYGKGIKMIPFSTVGLRESRLYDSLRAPTNSKSQLFQQKCAVPKFLKTER